ncbi:CYTH domain-containing protein [Isosphaeraceae bacterium EP7]
MKLISREYKVMLDHRQFDDRQAAADAFWQEVEDLASTTLSIRTQGRFDKREKQTIVFLDTPDLSLRRKGLVLRRRHGDEAPEYTLKCRSEDRYFAAGTDVSATGGLDAKHKLEEDIAPPFRCRFSHSNTVKIGGVGADRGLVTTLGEAGAMFPILRKLAHDGRPIPEETVLLPVHNLSVFERVFTGASFVFGDLGDRDDDESSVALILWSTVKEGRPLVAEFSFRLKDKEEQFTRELAESARSFYEAIQRLDWCRPDAVTKTTFIYRDKGDD